MADETATPQLWIRTETGRVLGPLGPSTLSILAEEGAFGARCEASRDGILFAEPWLFPELREVLPAALLGNDARAAPSAPEAGPLPQLVPGGPVGPGVPFRLYYLAAATSATGELGFTSPDGASFELYFRKGTPELARSTAAGLDLGSFLVAKEVVGADAIARAQAARSAHGGELLNALFAQGLLAPGRAFPLLAEHARAVLDRALSLEAGTFRWDPLAMPPASAFPLGGKWDLLCGAGRRIDPATVRRRLGAKVDLPVMRAGDGLARLEDLRLTAQESRVAAALDGTKSLAALVAASPAETDAILRTACFLAEVGLASFAASPRTRAVPPAAGAAAPAPAPSATRVAVPARPAPPRPVAPPPVRPIPGGVAVPTRPPMLRPASGAGGDAPLATDSQGVRAFLASLEGKDHFAVLGLSRAATAEQINVAYFRLARAFHPDTAGVGADPEVRRLKQDVTARLNGAYQMLSDDVRRTEYLRALEVGLASSQVDVAALLAAEERFAWATVRVKARRFAEALPALEMAIELNPVEGEFYAWRGYTRFVLAPEPRAAEAAAMADVHRALELSPKCAIAWLFAGRIANVVGQAARAADAYRKCLALDASQVEAQRELRLLEGRGTK